MAHGPSGFPFGGPLPAEPQIDADRFAATTVRERMSAHALSDHFLDEQPHFLDEQP